MPSTSLDPHKPHTFLAHIGAHILNKSVLPSTEPCGLCGSPAPLCQFYLAKGKGTYGQTKVDYSTSRGCPNLAVSFKYGVTMNSTRTAPCSNVPILCPLCPKNSPAIWKYTAKYHFMNHHPAAQLDQWKDLWRISKGEITAMREVWKKRKEVPKTRSKTKKKGDLGDLVISEAHSIAALKR